MFGSGGKGGGGKSPRDTHGPIVKSGPTRGQNRSRNNDGRWHAKRSDAGKSRGGGSGRGGCFLTTAACRWKGLPDNCHELETLRAFRDEFLMSFPDGRALVAEYYEIAPGITATLTDPEELDRVWSVIGRCVREIEARQFEQATDSYRALVRALEAKRQVSAR